jgi:hypothetical protein
MNQVLHIQIDRRRLDPGTILNMRAQRRQKRRLRHAAATGTGVDVGLMLGYANRARPARQKRLDLVPLIVT